jgi:hypothetical protein
VAKTNIKGVGRVELRPVVGDRAFLFYLDNLGTYDVNVVASPLGLFSLKVNGTEISSCLVRPILGLPRNYSAETLIISPINSCFCLASGDKSKPANWRVSQKPTTLCPVKYHEELEKTVTHAAAQLTPPSTPDTITVEEGNLLYFVGHCLWQPRLHLPADLNGRCCLESYCPPRSPLCLRISSGSSFRSSPTSRASMKIRSRASSPPASGNATWQSSLDSSRVWAVKVNGIDPSPEITNCSHAGSIQCLLLRSVGNKKGPTGGNLLANTSFIQRLNTNGGAVPTSSCTGGQTQLVHYTADYYFYRPDKQ